MKFFNRRTRPPPKEKVPDNKTLLRFARQYIDGKNMQEAQKCCKKVLKKDSQCYMALVLYGKSLGTSEEALNMYKRAIDIKPDNPLAWQGLAKYYETKDDEQSKNQLFEIYRNILNLRIDDDYAIKTINKQGTLGCLMKHSETISTLIEYMGVQRDECIMKTAEKQFLALLVSKVPIKIEDITNTTNMLKKINNTDSRNNVSMILLGKCILKTNEFANAVQQIIELEFFPESTMMKEWLCKVLCKIFIEKDDFYNFDIDNYINVLTTGVEDTIYGGTLLAIMDYRVQNYEEALRKCSLVVDDSEDTDIPEALFMLNCSRMIKNVSMTESLIQSFLTKEKLKQPEFLVTMNKIMLSCYIESNRPHEALICLNKIPIDEMDSAVLIDIANMYCEADAHGVRFDNILFGSDYLDLFKFLAYMRVEQYDQAIAVLRRYDKHPVKYYLLAQVYWQTEMFAHCLQSLQFALEFLPNHPKVYYSLGIYYYDHERNIYRSIQCFEKAYSICSTDIEVIRMLSVAYDQNLLRDTEYNLLETAVNSTETKKFWMCARLGRLCFLKGNMDDALIYLQEAIHLNRYDLTAYEWMGDVYYNTKAYDLALNAYEKVMDLSTDISLLVNCLSRIGSTYSRQTYYDKAIFIFERILHLIPDSIEALKGLTQNHILNAQKKSSNYLFSEARDELQMALNTITIIMTSGVTNLIYLHFYGDVLVSLTRLPKFFSYVRTRNPEGESRINKLGLYEMAIATYADIAKTRDTYALFKCAHTYLEYYVETKRASLLHASYNLSVLSIKAKPDSWRYWDLLGKVCYFLHKSDVAHYSFFKAIILNGDISAFKVWCNLGTLYLKINKDRLANYCFAVGKKCLPSYPSAWIGDGLLAEIIREDGNVGMFAPNPDSNEFEELTDLDFLDWVTAIHELSIPPTEPSFDMALDAFFIVPNRMDIIEWYLTFEQHTGWGCICLGLIQEYRGQINEATALYNKAYSLAEGDFKKETILHMSRLLMKRHNYDEAIKLYGDVDQVNLEATTALAKALYEEASYKESYIAYNKALNDLCQNDDDLVNVLIPMSNVAFKLNGCADAVRFVHRAAEITSPPMQTHVFNLSFLKTYAFGKIHVDIIAYIMSQHMHFYVDDGMWWYYMGLNYLSGDSGFAKIASLCIQRAIDVSLDTEYSREIGKMHAMISIAEFYSGDREEAMAYAKQALNIYPDQPELWAALILCVFSHRQWPQRKSWIERALSRVRQNITLPRSISEWLDNLEEKLRRE
ncbi:superkiller complex protein 3-like [Epargyreus clarus]|uniref:superkiller complex protein 3-like n=1 Tax=Epargyreus clarus TaxID=520877 RepID=UPI003C2D33AA